MVNVFKNTIAVLCLFLVSLDTFCQISIFSPVERTVFQRDNNNQGKVKISGIVSEPCDRVEARLVNRISGNGSSTSWITIDENVDNLSFQGSILFEGGWYKLEIRAVKDDDVLFETSIERVGIGEIFVIAGQSNAQGEGTSINAKSANDDRVNAFLPNYFNPNSFNYENIPPYFDKVSFVKINANTNIGPGGYSAWAYGELGDMLVSRLGVPVLFFNAANSGTTSGNWANSTTGNLVYNDLTRDQYGNLLPILEKGSPYRMLQVTIQSISNLLGFRAILWHQGEFDSFLNVNPNTYFSNMLRVIEKSRSDMGYEIPWVVARAARYYNYINMDIIYAQNRIIDEISSVWPGPETDDIQENRYDNAHFQNTPGGIQGLTLLARAWNSSLTNSFFNESNPVLPQDFLNLKISCSGQNNVSFSVNNSFREYYWSDGSKSQTLTKGRNDGMFFLAARDANGVMHYSNIVQTKGVFPYETPNVISPDGLVGCKDGTVKLLVSDPKYAVVWNTGANSQSLQVTKAGAYSARYLNQNNCYSEPGKTQNVTFTNPASKPLPFFINGDGSECEGSSVRIGISNIQNSKVLWSTGATGNEIVLTQNLDEPLTVTLFKIPGCPSEPSDQIPFHIFPNPEKPDVVKFGPYYLAYEGEKTDFVNWYIDGGLKESGGNPFILRAQSGEYSTQGGKIYTTTHGRSFYCLSEISEPFQLDESDLFSGISVFPNPSSDGKIYITSNELKENVEVKLIDITGRTLFFQKLPTLSNPILLDLSSHSLSGKYFIKVVYQSQTKVFPVIFER